MITETTETLFTFTVKNIPFFNCFFSFFFFPFLFPYFFFIVPIPFVPNPLLHCKVSGRVNSTLVTLRLGPIKGLLLTPEHLQTQQTWVDQYEASRTYIAGWVLVKTLLCRVPGVQLTECFTIWFLLESPGLFLLTFFGNRSTFTSFDKDILMIESLDPTVMTEEETSRTPRVLSATRCCQEGKKPNQGR